MKKPNTVLLGIHRCKKTTVSSHRTSSSSSHTAFPTSASLSNNQTGSASGSSSSQSGNTKNSKISSRIIRVPFHKRNSSASASNYHQTCLSSSKMASLFNKNKDPNSNVYDNNSMSSTIYQSSNSATTLQHQQQQPTTSSSDIRFVFSYKNSKKFKKHTFTSSNNEIT